MMDAGLRHARRELELVSYLATHHPYTHTRVYSPFLPLTLRERVLIALGAEVSCSI